MPHILSAFGPKLALLKDVRGNLRTVLSASEQSQIGFILVYFRSVSTRQNIVAPDFGRRPQQKLNGYLLVSKISKERILIYR